ncbi:MAG: GAF domain-containing protein [Scytonematopsis contorta HA4267-MV1]|nr:GAF domain-containing protein [Scytonematopsis contorta HA4267-MV1]
MNQPLRVLLVQNSVDDATLLLNQLQNLGGGSIVIGQVDTVTAFSTALRQRKWDIVIVDNDSKQLGYEQVLLILRQIESSLPVIVVSEEIGAEATVRALKAGVSDIVIKANLARLTNSIELVLREVKLQERQKLSGKYEDLLKKSLLPEMYNPKTIVGVEKNYSNPQRQLQLATPTRKLDSVSFLPSQGFYSDIVAENSDNNFFHSSEEKLEFLKYDDLSYTEMSDSAPYKIGCCYQKSETQLQVENHILELIFKGTGLLQTLEAIARFIENSSAEDVKCCLLLVDDDGRNLHNCIAPSLPTKYQQAIDGIPIESCAASCGTAAYRRELVIAEEIVSDSLWINYRDVALDCGLQACWSAPILTAEGSVLGTFAMYTHQPRKPNTNEKQLIVQATYLAGIAIERYRNKEKKQILGDTFEELQRTQMQLLQTEKMCSLGQLVAGIAHEINNPVNFIYNNLNFVCEYIEEILALLELYQQHYPNPNIEIQKKSEAIDLEFVKEDLPKMLSSMKLGTDRIYEIILSLRNFSRSDQKERQSVDINKILDSVVLILQHRIKPNGGKPGIKIIKEYGDLPLVTCYPGQLNQVFMNLIANAVDALEESLIDNRQICIRTQVTNDNSHALIQISDNGSGISHELQQQIFNPFFTTKPVGKGTGLGLSISHEIIAQKHGGNLKCISEPEQGTEFWIELPL